MTAVLNLAVFPFSPTMGAVALPFSVGIAATLLNGMVKIAGALYVFLFGVLFLFISPIVGLVALGFGGAAAVRIIVRR